MLDLQRTAGNRAVTALVQREESTTDEAAPVVGADAGSSDMQRAEEHFHRGERHYRAEKFGAAFDQFALADELHPAPEIKFAMAQAARRMGGKREEAVALFEAYLASGATERKAVAEGHLADLRGPAATGDSAIDDPAAEKAYLKGESAYATGRFGVAYDHFEVALELYPDPAIVFSMAQCLRRLGGRRDEAIDLYNNYLATGDGARAAHAKSALAELMGPEVSGDEEIDKPEAKAQYEKGSAAYARKEYGRAFDLFTNTYSLFPAPEIQFTMAQCLYHMGGRTEEAVALYVEYLRKGDDARSKDAKDRIRELGGAVPDDV